MLGAAHAVAAVGAHAELALDALLQGRRVVVLGHLPGLPPQAGSGTERPLAGRVECGGTVWAPERIGRSSNSRGSARRTPSNLFLISEMSLKWPTLITPKEVQRHENMKITLIFDCMIVLGAEFYVPNGAEGAVCLPTLPTLPFQRCEILFLRVCA